MKILSILPADLNSLDPQVAQRKRRDRQLLAGLPSEICPSYHVAHLLQEDKPFFYDVVVSAYTPVELLSPRDFVPGASGHYGAATHHVVQLLKDDPIAVLALWSGAAYQDVDLPAEADERIVFCGRNVPTSLRDIVDLDLFEVDLLRGAIVNAMTEFCLMLDAKGEFVLTAICRRGPVEMTFQNPERRFPARPCLGKAVLAEEKPTAEFLRLLNREGVAAQDLEAFLADHPAFPVGQDLQAFRWMVGLRREPGNPEDVPPDILLEPVWTADGWNVPGLKTPGLLRAPPGATGRPALCRRLAAALPLLRSKQAVLDGARFKRRLTEAGVDGFVPRLALVLGRKAALPLPARPPEAFRALPALTYADLEEIVRTEMAWLAEPTPLLDNMIAHNVRKQKIREEVAAMLGIDVGQLK